MTEALLAMHVSNEDWISSVLRKYLSIFFFSMPLIVTFNCYQSSITECERLIRALARYGQICDSNVPWESYEGATCISDEELGGKGFFDSISECADFIEGRMPGCDEYSVEEIWKYRREQIEKYGRFREGRSPFPEGCGCQIPLGDLRFACLDAIKN